MLTVSVLGPVELHRDGELLPIRPGKTTEVLVRLALEAGLVVRSERIIEDLWGPEAVGTQRNTLQTKVSRLRKELGDASLVTGDRSGYTLHVEPDDVDALRVTRLAGEIRDALAAGDAATAVALATDALASFRGEVLVDAGDGDWVTPHRSRLEEIRLQLAEDRLAGLLARGGGGELVPEIETLVAVHPLRERLWVALVTALYRGGRQADALAALGTVRGVLVDELGVDPGPELRELERRVLDQDPELSPAPVATGNLPSLTATMLGRDDELTALRDALDTARLVTLVGPAGVGKTRLAIEAARGAGAPSGSWLVRLDAVATSDAVVEAVATTWSATDATEAQLLERVRGADLLLVLDNCEHVADGVAELVPRLLDHAPGLRVLATSQVPLGLDGETVFPLAPLPPEVSVQLFARRAAEHRTTFTLDDDTTAVVRELCDALDGLPLAIELAAARARTLSVPEIARRLDDRFALLRDATGRRPERQRALAAAIEWSYDLLFPDDQRGLWALSQFAGSPTVDAVEAVLAALEVPATAALDVITRLVDRSLVTVDEDGPDRSRYRLLDSVRAFSRARCLEAGCADATAAAHASWYGAVADAARHGTRGPEQAGHLRTARGERTDIDAAVGWAADHDPRLALRIVNGFGWAWVVIGEGGAAVRRLRAALIAAADVATASELAEGWSHVAWLAAGDDLVEAHTAAEQALAIATAAGDDAATARARLALGYVQIQEARPDDALATLATARATFEALGADWEVGSCRVLAVHATLFGGDADAAQAACADAERVVRTLDDAWAAGHLDAVLGRVATLTGRPDVAAEHLRRAADSAARLGFPTSEGYHLVNLGCAQLDGGDAEDARVTLERAVEIGTGAAEPRLTALACTHLGRALRARGEADAARAELTAADTWFRASGGGDGAALAAALLADG